MESNKKTDLSCPKCQAEMAIIKQYNLEVDFCSNCGGIFVERAQLKDKHLSKFAEMKARSGHDQKALNSMVIECPKCYEPMKKNKALKVGAPTLDKCVSCGSIWFDEGEYKSHLQGKGWGGKKFDGLVLNVTCGGCSAQYSAKNFDVENEMMLRCPRCKEFLNFYPAEELWSPYWTVPMNREVFALLMACGIIGGTFLLCLIAFSDTFAATLAAFGVGVPASMIIISVFVYNRFGFRHRAVEFNEGPLLFK